MIIYLVYFYSMQMRKDKSNSIQNCQNAIEIQRLYYFKFIDYKEIYYPHF